MLATIGMCFVFQQVQSTNAFFSDLDYIKENTITAGFWIPVLSMSVSPKHPDSDGWYTQTPCVTLKSLIGDSEEGSRIYYEISENASDGNPIDDGKIYGDSCIEIPDGSWNFQAQSVNVLNENWKSNIVTAHFDVDTQRMEKGDIIINEIMWMGSSDGAKDQWIELRNMTDRNISLKNWDIAGAVEGHDGHLEIANNDDELVIKSHGYFLIANKGASKSALDVKPDLVKTSIDFDSSYEKNGKVILQDKRGRTIDETPDAKSDDWPAGAKKDSPDGDSLYMSMQRDNDPGSGESASNWSTCKDKDANDKTYWDDEEANYGTPGSKNLYDDNYEDEFSSTSSSKKSNEPSEKKDVPNFQADENPSNNTAFPAASSSGNIEETPMVLSNTQISQ